MSVHFPRGKGVTKLPSTQAARAHVLDLKLLLPSMTTGLEYWRLAHSTNEDCLNFVHPLNSFPALKIKNPKWQIVIFSFTCIYSVLVFIKSFCKKR